MYTNYCIDFDDFCDVTVKELEHVDRLHDTYPNMKVTLFTIPMRTSPASIKLAKQLGDWVQLAPHGWRHTRGECLAWNEEEAESKIRAAADMGIDAPVFRAPAWLLDADVYEACKNLDYTVATHKTYRIPFSGVREYVYNLDKRPRMFCALHGHMTDCGFDYIVDMASSGKFLNLQNAIFKFPQELAIRTPEVQCAF